MQIYVIPELANKRDSNNNKKKKNKKYEAASLPPQKRNCSTLQFQRNGTGPTSVI
jgi:hypothetical protein